MDKKELTISFNPSLYNRFSNPCLSLDNSIVMRVETLDGHRKQVVCFDNAIHKLPFETVSKLLNEFIKEIDKVCY